MEKMIRITKNDTPVTISAKKAAIICTYAIRNPLHVFFEDGNFHTGPMGFEREWNEEFREENGERMYELIAQFLDEFEELNEEERRESFRLFRRKWDYQEDKRHKKILENSEPRPKGSGLGYRVYLKEDGHIYAKTDLNIEVLLF